MQFFAQLSLDRHQQTIAVRVLQEIEDELGSLERVGLGDLTLNQQVATVSGG